MIAYPAIFIFVAEEEGAWKEKVIQRSQKSFSFKKNLSSFFLPGFHSTRKSDWSFGKLTFLSP